MAILSVYTGSAFDAIWHHLVTIDPYELLDTRERMKMQLARYGKQDLHKWDNIEVAELKRWWERLKEIIDNENSITSATED